MTKETTMPDREAHPIDRFPSVRGSRLDPDADPLVQIAIQLTRIADALERQAPPSMVIKAQSPSPVTEEQVKEIERMMRERLRRSGGRRVAG